MNIRREKEKKKRRSGKKVNEKEESTGDKIKRSFLIAM
jgi:hypothetical protein